MYMHQNNCCIRREGAGLSSSVLSAPSPNRWPVKAYHSVLARPACGMARNKQTKKKKNEKQKSALNRCQSDTQHAPCVRVVVVGDAGLVFFFRSLNKANPLHNKCCDPLLAGRKWST